MEASRHDAEILIQNLFVEYIITRSPTSSVTIADSLSENVNHFGDCKITIDRLSKNLKADFDKCELLDVAIYFVIRIMDMDNMDCVIKGSTSKVVEMYEAYILLPPLILNLFSLFLLLKLAEHAGNLRKLSHRVQWPMGYSSECNILYYNVLYGELRKIRRNLPRHHHYIIFSIFRDDSSLIFGLGSKRREKNERKMRRAISNFGYDQKRCNELCNFQIVIDNIKNKKASWIGLEVCLFKIWDDYKQQRKKYDNISSELFNLNLLIRKRIFRLGDTGKFLRISFGMLKFLNENTDSKSVGYKCHVFAINLNIGIVLLASRKGLEATPFLKRALNAIKQACQDNLLVNKYYKWYRFYIEALVAQSDREFELAVLSMEKCVEILEEVSSLDRFVIPYWHEIKDKGALRRRYASKNKSKRRKIIREEALPECEELDEWTKCIPEGIVSGKQNCEGARTRMKKCLNVAISGYEIYYSGGDSMEICCNLAEYFLLGDTWAYYRMERDLQSAEFNYDHVLQHYHNILNPTNSIHRQSTPHFSLVSISYSIHAHSLDLKKEGLVMLAHGLVLMSACAETLTYSISLIVVRHFEHVSKAILSRTIWSREDVATISEALNLTFEKIESRMSSTLDSYARDLYARVLHKAYVGVAEAWGDALARTDCPAATKDIAKLIIFTMCKSRLCLVNAARDRALAARIAEAAAPEDLKSQFLTSEEDFRTLRKENTFLRYFRKKAVGDHSSVRRGLMWDEKSSDAGPRYRATERNYIESLYLLQQDCPDFRWDLTRDEFPSQATVFRCERNQAKIWIEITGGRILFVILAKNKLVVTLCDDSESQWIGFRCGIAGKRMPFATSENEVHFGENIERMRKLLTRVFKSSRLNSSPHCLVRLYVCPELAGFPLSDVILPFHEIKVIHSPNCLLTDGIIRKNSKIESILFVCPDSRLRFSLIERDLSWRSTGRKLTLNADMDSMELFKKMVSTVSVFHYSGHAAFDGDGVPYLFSIGSVKIDLPWIVENVRFSEGPLVLLNACSSATSAGSPEIAGVYNCDSRAIFSGNCIQASLATAFITCGAAVVIATTRDIDDLSAMIFGWKLSSLARANKDFDVEAAFFKTLNWCRSIKRIECLNAIFDDIRVTYQPPEAEKKIMEICSRFQQNERCSEFLADDYWDCFVIYKK